MRRRRLQLTPAAAPGDSAAAYHFDLARYFFASPAAEVAARGHLRERVGDAPQRGRASDDLAGGAARARSGSPTVSRSESKRHTIYLDLLAQLNTLDEASAQAQSTLEAELDAATSVVDNGLLKLDDARLAAWTRTLPALETYRFAIESVRRVRKYTLPAEQEAIVSRLAPHRPTTGRWRSTTDSSPAPTSAPFKRQPGSCACCATAARSMPCRHGAPCRGTAQVVGGLRGSIGISTPWRCRVRCARGTAWPAFADTSDAPDEAYRRAYLSTDEVRALLERVRPAAQVYKSFQRVSEQIARQPRPAPPAGGARRSSSP